LWCRTGSPSRRTCPLCVAADFLRRTRYRIAHAASDARARIWLALGIAVIVERHDEADFDDIGPLGRTTNFERPSKRRITPRAGRRSLARLSCGKARRRNRPCHPGLDLGLARSFAIIVAPGPAKGRHAQSHAVRIGFALCMRVLHPQPRQLCADDCAAASATSAHLSNSLMPISFPRTDSS